MKESILAINSYQYTDNPYKEEEDSNMSSMNSNKGNILKSSKTPHQQQQQL